MRSSGPGFLFVGRFLITVSISMLLMALLRFSISSWFSFGRLYFLRIHPCLPSCLFYWYIVPDSSLMILCISVLSVVISPFSFLILLIWFFSFFFKWWVWLMVCLFYLPSQRTSFSVQFGHSVVSNSLWPHKLQHARPRCPSPTPGIYSNSCPLSQWCHPAISSSVVFPSPPAPNTSQHQGLFQWVNSSNQVAKVLEFRLQHQSF